MSVVESKNFRRLAGKLRCHSLDDPHGSVRDGHGDVGHGKADVGDALLH